jgi:hypothetical protein
LRIARILVRYFLCNRTARDARLSISTSAQLGCGNLFCFALQGPENLSDELGVENEKTQAL